MLKQNLQEPQKKQQLSLKLKHVSFSELKIWNECSWRHKVNYVDGNRLFKGNEYTAFGKAVHDVCEQLLISKTKIEPKKYFESCFLNELQALKRDNIELNSTLVKDMRQQGVHLVDYILPAVEEYFVDYEIISTEEKIYEDIEDEEHKFKGFIDLVIKTSDGKYHVIDWKTCSWGWNKYRKTDKITTYQLTFYKYYFAKKHGIELKNINTYFALLKRTAKKNKVEIFKVTSGDKKTQNALNFLKKALYNIGNAKYIKNRLSCTYCDLYKTKYCT